MSIPLRAVPASPRQMLQFAEEECRRRGITRLELSTAEPQCAALALYRQAG